jgi:hypothetical protein
LGLLLSPRRASPGRLSSAVSRHLAGQQRGAVFEAHHGERRFGAALLLRLGLGGVMLVGFVVVDPDASVVPVSL